MKPDKIYARISRFTAVFCVAFPLFLLISLGNIYNNKLGYAKICDGDLQVTTDSKCFSIQIHKCTFHLRNPPIETASLLWSPNELSSWGNYIIVEELGRFEFLPSKDFIIKLLDLKHKPIIQRSFLLQNSFFLFRRITSLFHGDL